MHTIIKPERDVRLFRAIRLENEVECVLVHDDSVKICSSSISVGRGSFSDPSCRPGIAHFVEHMLFMGNEKYPLQNEYSEFLSAHSGYSNAFTDSDKTSYSFEVAAQFFEEAVQKFTHFFTSPLFKEDSVSRQIQAVHSEFQQRLNYEYDRSDAVLGLLGYPDAPRCRFTVGNKESLGFPTIRQDVVDFFRQNYSSNLMKACLVGCQSLDQLERIARVNYSLIPNRNYHRAKFEQPAFDANNLCKLVKMVPIQEKHTLQLRFFTKSYMAEFKQNPGNYVSSLVGEEGKGSLLAALIQEGLALELTTNYQEAADPCGLLTVEIELTDEGLADYQRVLRIFFTYIEMLRGNIADKRLFEERKLMLALKFSSLDKANSYQCSEQIAADLQDFPVQYVLQHEYLLQELKPALLSAFLEEVRPGRLVAILKSQQFQSQCTNTEHYYQAKYLFTEFPESVVQFQKEKLVEKTSLQLHIPCRNEYLAAEEGLTEEQNQLMRLISTELLEVYHKPNPSFRVPKLAMNSVLLCKFKNSARAEVSRRLLVLLLQNYLRDLFQMGTSAGIEASVREFQHGLKLQVNGLSTCLAKYTLRLLRLILQFKAGSMKKYFNKLKKKLVEQISNFELESPSEQYDTRLQVLLFDNLSFPSDTLLKQLRAVKLKDMVEFQELFFSQLKMLMTVNGNMGAAKCQEFGKEVEQLLASKATPFKPESLNLYRPVLLRSQEKVVRVERLKNKEEKNSLILAHFWAGFEQKKPVLRVIDNFMDAIVFDQLRNKRQLGYFVAGRSINRRGFLAVQFVVQGSAKTPAQVSTIVDQLLGLLWSKVQTMREEELQLNKQSCLTKLRQPITNIYDEGQELGSCLRNLTLNFNFKEQLIRGVELVTLEQFKAQFSRVFREDRRVVELHLLAKTAEEPNRKRLRGPTLDSIEQFRKLRVLAQDQWQYSFK